MALAVAMNYSCSEKDNPATPDTPETPEVTKTIIELDGKKYETDLVATLKGVIGEEVSLTLGVYDAFDIYGVDFGDGNIVADTVCFQNGGLKDEAGYTVEWRKSATVFKGVVAGDGIVKVYGNSDVWYLVAAGGAVPTSLDQEKLKKVVQLKISGAEVDAIDLNGLECLEIFGFSQGSLGSLKCAGATLLRDVTVNNNTASKFDSKLASIDLSKNENLESLNLMAASADKPGLLKELDLSNNPNLEKLYAQYNQLTSVKLPASAEISFLNLQNNQLESIDLSVLASLKDTYLNNNMLKAVDLSKVKEGANLYLDGNELTEVTVPVKVKNLQLQNNQLEKVSVADASASCKLENNRLNFATLPTKPVSLNTTSKIKKFTYSPQAKLNIKAKDGEIDGSFMATAQGILEAPVATTYKITAEGVELVKGTDADFDEVSPLRIKFHRPFKNVVVTLNSEAFPALTLESEPFDVD